MVHDEKLTVPTLMHTPPPCKHKRKTCENPIEADGKIADVLALTHACTTANASVNFSMYVPQRPSKVPIAPMGYSHILLVVCRAAVSSSRAAQ